jgi:hypothetical protein
MTLRGIPLEMHSNFDFFKNLEKRLNTTKGKKEKNRKKMATSSQHILFKAECP